MKENKIIKTIQSLNPWFHNIHLPDGTQTAPGHFLGDFPGFKWKNIEPFIPEDLTGWTALDVGCNAGYYTVELAKRGADVLAIDVDPHYLEQAKWVVSQFDLENKVEFRQMQVYDLAHLEKDFDLIWYMGVMYHLRYPLLSLDILSQKVNKMMIFQTLTMPGKEVLETPDDVGIHGRNIMKEEGWPKMAFIEKRLSSDMTNWWAPNHACIEAMLRSCGLKVTDYPEDECYVLEPFEGDEEHQVKWNKSEFLSATGKKWEQEVKEKVKRKNTLV